MIRRILSLLCVLALLWTVLPCAAEDWSYDIHDEMGDSVKTGSMYVYTANGKTLSLRSIPKSSGEILRYIPFAAKVTVLDVNGSWSHISYNGTTGYVVSKYLVSTRPSKGGTASSGTAGGSSSASKTGKDSKTNKSTTTTLSVKAVKPEDLTELDMAADASVEPTLPATEALRYQKPDQKSKVLARYESGYEVYVRALSEDWALVYDPKTKKEGYMLLEELVMDYIDEEDIEEDLEDETEDGLSEDEEVSDEETEEEGA